MVGERSTLQRGGQTAADRLTGFGKPLTGQLAAAYASAIISCEYFESDDKMHSLVDWTIFQLTY